MIAIVGGGVAGLSVARALTVRASGVPVALFEAEHVGAGASGVPVALLNPYRGRSARASALDLAGLHEMWSLHMSLRAAGYDDGMRFGGVVRLATSARQARQWRARLAEDGRDDGAPGGVRWLLPDEVPPGYHAPFGGFVVRHGGWLEPRRFLTALAADARAHGAELYEGAKVTALARRGAGWVLGIERKRGSGTVSAAQVVLCTGAAPWLGSPLVQSVAEVFTALERVRGDVVTLHPAPALPYPLAGAIYGVGVAGGFVAGGNHRDPDAPDPDAPTRVATGAAHFIPALRGASITAHWTGVRARRPDNRPLHHAVEPGLWVLGGLSGRGFLAAALLARQLAARIIP